MGAGKGRTERFVPLCDGKKLGYTVKVNGKPAESTLEKGYFTIQRKWKKGDIVDIHFDMEPRIVKANYKVEADRGRVSVERGPGGVLCRMAG